MRDDEAQAFEAFMANTADRLLLSAVLLVGGDWAAGGDLLQGAFERTYRHWPRIGGGNPEAYVRRVLANAATSRWRRLRARVTEVPLITDGEWTVDVAAAGADPAEALAQRGELIRALRALPPRQRAVLVLRYVDDLPEGEAAAALGCSVGTVRSQAHRGLARLRDDQRLHALRPPRPRAVTGPDVLTNEPVRAAAGPGETAQSSLPASAGRHRAKGEEL
ncbi:SigE family RNA polymerase sigma factor [Pseudofrankia asymbiotica]|uniref:SigE family RNA polymerase sigma factor n=1 Tax=Pseudofrankia asymbiotica TaxID=1834516 RepID=UPI0009D67DCA|nr:SigE family RNA polymerase sigma factor [Pseudofrankia asymbiotica]